VLSIRGEWGEKQEEMPSQKTGEEKRGSELCVFASLSADYGMFEKQEKKGDRLME